MSLTATSLNQIPPEDLELPESSRLGKSKNDESQNDSFQAKIEISTPPEENQKIDENNKTKNNSLYQTFSKSNSTDFNAKMLQDHPSLSASQLFSMQRSGMSQAEIIFKVEALMNKMSNFQGEQARLKIEEEEESNKNVQQQSNDKIQLTADINKNNNLEFQSENQNLLEEENTKNDIIILEPKKQETEQGNSDTVTTTTDIKADINSFSEHNLNNLKFHNFHNSKIETKTDELNNKSNIKSEEEKKKEVGNLKDDLIESSTVFNEGDIPIVGHATNSNVKVNEVDSGVGGI